MAEVEAIAATKMYWSSVQSYKYKVKRDIDNGPENEMCMTINNGKVFHKKFNRKR